MLLTADALYLAGYSCRLISQTMSLIMVNEDSLDVSTCHSFLELLLHNIYYVQRNIGDVGNLSALIMAVSTDSVIVIWICDMRSRSEAL